MAKEYKVSYKTYFNTRLNKALFHGEETHPLYLQVTYRRKSMFFRSNLFELLSRPKFNSSTKKRSGSSVIERIIKKEEELLEWSANNMPEDFTLEDFKQIYDFYSTELCNLTEKDFRIYIFFFLKKKKADILGMVLANKSREYLVSDILKEMERVFDKPLYDEFINGVYSYGFLAAPYLLLYDFARKTTFLPYFFTIMDWESNTVRKEFEQHILKFYPDKNAAELRALIDKRVDVYRDRGN